jgi:MSHA biogenesis protein MshJ
MTQYWQKMMLKIDALSLRERVIIFAMIAIMLIVTVNITLLDPQFVKQKNLSDQIQAQQAKINLIQAEIRQTIQVQSDPDAVGRGRLQSLKQQATQMQAVLLDMQKGLVSPDKMSVLLEDILKRNGNLRLLSLKTLPVSSLAEPIPSDTKITGVKTVVTASSPVKSTADNQPVAGSVYKHGVEIVVQGAYLDMMNYMAELEAMPWQLFWGKAKLNVDEYPKATLTLTLFTMSLDKKWLNL